MSKIFLILGIAISATAIAQQKTIQERLGYPKETKLLIIHADDMGVSHAENAGSIYTMEKGVVTSGSIMVPCPWFPEIAGYAIAHPNADIGLHLTLTSEWKNFKWGPVAPSDKVPSLLDEQGYFNNSTLTLMKNGKPEEVEKELHAQIERAKKFGIDFTHFEPHMAGAVSTPEFLKIYIKLGREYKVPVMLSQDLSKLFKINLADFVSDKEIIVDKFIMATWETYIHGMENYYTEQIKSLPAGLSIIQLHAAYDDAEMKAVTSGHVDYGSAWRQADVDFFTSEYCKKLLEEEKVKLVTWREVREKVIRK